MQKFRRAVWVVLPAVHVVLPLHFLLLLLAGCANNEVGSGVSDSFEKLEDNPPERSPGQTTWW
jgi:hypothetical protein